METFARGLDAFRRGDLDVSERSFRATLSLRGDADGPSRFYLKEIATLRQSGLPPDWSGVVEFTSK
jgi:hypothetical protein